MDTNKYATALDRCLLDCAIVNEPYRHLDFLLSDLKEKQDIPPEVVNRIRHRVEAVLARTGRPRG
jgi:hypothetical protein